MQAIGIGLLIMKQNKSLHHCHNGMLQPVISYMNTMVSIENLFNMDADLFYFINNDMKYLTNILIY